MTAERIDKSLFDNDYVPEDSNPIRTTANMLEELFLLDENKPKAPKHHTNEDAFIVPVHTTSKSVPKKASAIGRKL
jgi:hypothetical protein